MTISATTQGLRMGVATSSSRPTVPFDGQVISETDTDSLQVYKGSAWAPVSGLQYITGASFTAATSVSLPASTFTSTYKNYKVIFNYVGSDTTSAATIRLRASGTDVSASNYYNGLGLSSYGGTTYVYGTSAGTSWTLNLISSNQAQLELLIGRPQETSPTGITGNVMAGVSGQGLAAGYIGGFYTASTSVDSLSLIIASAATVTGTYRVYGLADA